MCCTPRGSSVLTRQAATCGCGCGTTAGFGRRFLSAEEEIERLKTYRQELLKEAAEVDKRISSLTK
jgi:hypothetical protein